jgi:hypothetical protein
MEDLKILDCLQHNPNYSIEYQRALGLHSLGYRRASDVAREIFAEIDKIIDTYGDEYGIMLTVDKDDLAELKKKYESEEK